MKAELKSTNGILTSVTVVQMYEGCVERCYNRSSVDLFTLYANWVIPLWKRRIGVSCPIALVKMSEELVQGVQ